MSVIFSVIKNNHFNNFISETLSVCHDTSSIIDVTNSSFSLKVDKVPDEKENMKWRENEGVKNHQRVRTILYGAVLPLSGLAALQRLGQHHTKHMAGKERNKAPSAPPFL